jgi:hypothetical protein
MNQRVSLIIAATVLLKYNHDPPLLTIRVDQLSGGGSRFYPFLWSRSVIRGARPMDLLVQLALGLICE